MIDTTKYDGAVSGPLEIGEVSIGENRYVAIVSADHVKDKFFPIICAVSPVADATIQDLRNAILLADSPILLAEVKRITAENEALRAKVDAMKCCGNCFNYSDTSQYCKQDNGLTTSYSTCKEWEPIK